MLESLAPDRLMQYMRVLCKEIGPRPPGSEQEKRAAEYVRRVLWALDVKDVEEQHFKTHRTIGALVLPALLLGLVGFIVGGLGGRRAKLLGGLAALGAAYTTRNTLLARQPLYQGLFARAESRNVIALIPPRGETRRRLYLIGHLDTNKQRFSAPLIFPALMKPFATLSMLFGILAAVEMLVNGLRNKRGFSTSHALAMLTTGQAAVMAGYDEAQPYIEGANDNATAVAVLLGVAEQLRETPLEHTEVALLFTGSEETICTGMEHYLRAYRPPTDNTYWIDLEMVGTGNICYVTKHGISHLTEYHPSPDMLPIAARAAIKHPALAIAGKDMIILEEVASLVRRGYKAICIAGYDQEGYLPNWHRLTDTLERIDPETLSRAARYTWAVMQEVDALP